MAAGPGTATVLVERDNSEDGIAEISYSLKMRYDVALEASV
jgi:hypothetical protein